MSSKNFNIPDKDNGLSKLAADFELCKEIPAGAFEDSTLVWVWDTDGNKAVIGRYNLKFSPVTEEEDYCPAPTMEEIVKELPTHYKDGFLTIRPGVLGYQKNWKWTLILGDGGMHPGNSLAESALQLWFHFEESRRNEKP